LYFLPDEVNTPLGYYHVVYSVYSRRKNKQADHVIVDPWDASHYFMISDTVRVLPVPVLQDNYSYLIIDEVSGNTAAVDVNDAGKVYEYFLQTKNYYTSKKGLELSFTHVFCTHRHWDHAGGIVLL
jgi:hypothetical protein